MEEENKIEEKQEQEKTAEAEKLKKFLSPENLIASYGKGKLQLSAPIPDGSRTVEELKFDFTKLTGQEYTEAMDTDGRANDVFRLTATQAVALFSAAAAKQTDGISAREIQAGLGIMDAQKGAQLAAIFFSASNRAGNARISKL